MTEAPIELINSKKYAGFPVHRGTRWLAIAAGCLSGVAGALQYGPFSLIIPSVLVLGAIIQPWSFRPGKWLMWLGAFFLTLYVGFLFAPQIVDITVNSGLRSLDSLRIWILFSLTAASVLLVVWCDIALAVEGRRSRHAVGTVEQRFPRAGDWIVWLAAGCLTIFTGWYIIRSVFPFRHYGRWDILLLALVFGLAVLSLDTALLVHAVKKFRSRQFPSGSGR
jgi:hypothetical protein